jgi:hypothetical protein
MGLQSKHHAVPINLFLTLTSVLIQHPDDIPEPSPSDVGRHLYFELLELQPIKLLLSFMRTERINSEEKFVSLCYNLIRLLSTL